jgi:hypothetical protein
MTELKLFTAKQAAKIVGVTDRRIRQLASSGEIDCRRFGINFVITELGIEQAKKRNTKLGRPKNSDRRKAA